LKAGGGYTFHEHYDKLGLINMNGRVYDPIVGRFLSVDPLVGNPLSAQDYNGYSYCANNPLKYTDPSGYTSMSLSEFIKNGLNSTYGGYWESDGSGSGSGSSYMFSEEQSFQAGADYNNFHDSWGYTEFHNGATVTSSTSIHFNARMLQRSPSWNIGFFQRIARSFTTTKEPRYRALAPVPQDIANAGGDDPNSYVLFPNRGSAEKYINRNADKYGKEIFWYILEDHRVLVGPWNDAVNTPTKKSTSPRYADRFYSGGKVKVGANEYVKADYYVHLHFDHADPTDPDDYDVFDYFWKNGNVMSLIYLNGTYYYRKNGKNVIINP